MQQCPEAEIECRKCDLIYLRKKKRAHNCVDELKESRRHVIEERDLLRQQLDTAKRMLAEQIDSDVEELIRRGNRDRPD